MCAWASYDAAARIRAKLNATLESWITKRIKSRIAAMLKGRNYVGIDPIGVFVDIKRLVPARNARPSKLFD